MDMTSYLLGKKSSGGGGSRKVYETTYNVQNNTFGDIEKDLTIDDLSNGAIKIEYTYSDGNKQNTVVNIFNIVFSASDTSINGILLVVYNLATYGLGELLYTLDGKLAWYEWGEINGNI